MNINYSQDPRAVRARSYYYANREEILKQKRFRYAVYSDTRKSCRESNEEWRQANLEYSRALQRLNAKIRYWVHSGKNPMASEIVKSLKVEKRLLQMSKENRKKPMVYLPA